MFIENIEILNLWGKKESIKVPFDNRVTFITGINGSGKSSLLNVIFDSLIPNPKKFSKPSTSKNRFWCSRASFSNNLLLDTFILPNFGNDPDENSEIEDLLQDDFFNLDVIHKVQDYFENSSKDNLVTYIGHESVLKGEWWRKTLNFSDKNKSELEGEIKGFEEKAPLAFLFQEDRTTLHNMDKSSIDRSSIYWGLYRSSIDERFAYCRDAIQVRESHLNKEIVKEIQIFGENIDFNKLINSSSFKATTKSQKEIENMINTLNSYFLDSGKCIARDEDNKITLARIVEDENHFMKDISFDEDNPFVEDNNELISWNLLSRGEKTLLYLFFAVYYYKDRVKVFLLDEPEISFHVNWQKRLIKDLSELAPNNQFIVATHSPSLVMDGWLPNCLELKI